MHCSPRENTLILYPKKKKKILNWGFFQLLARWHGLAPKNLQDEILIKVTIHSTDPEASTWNITCNDSNIRQKLN